MDIYYNVPVYLFACAPLLERAALSAIVTTPPDLGSTLEAFVRPLFDLAYPSWAQLRYDTFLTSYSILRTELTIDGVDLVFLTIGIAFATALNEGFDAGAIALDSPRPLIVTGF